MVYSGMALVLSLGLAGCASAPTKEASKSQNTTAEEKKPILLGKKEVKSMELQSVKQKEEAKTADDAAMRALAAAMESGKAVKLTLNAQIKKNIASHLTVTYKDGTSDVYAVWTDKDTVTVAKSTDAAKTDGYQIKKMDAEGAVAFLAPAASQAARQLTVEVNQLRLQDVTHMYVSSAGKKKELAAAQREQVVKLYNEAEVEKPYTGSVPKGGTALTVELKNGQTITLYASQDGFLANTGQVFYAAKQPEFRLSELEKQAK